VTSRRRRIASVKELKQKGTLKFTFVHEGIHREAFLAHFQGEIRAYENVCRHLPLSLDYGNGRFFTPDGRHFVCQTHGAIYEPLTGECIAGPCVGASLKRLSIEIVEGEIWFEDPDGEHSP
jgi:nitrite reductase/ring-hydroxylating ferredoxin subunit